MTIFISAKCPQQTLSRKKSVKKQGLKICMFPRILNFTNLVKTQSDGNKGSQFCCEALENDKGEANSTRIFTYRLCSPDKK